MGRNRTIKRRNRNAAKRKWKLIKNTDRVFRFSDGKDYIVGLKRHDIGDWEVRYNKKEKWFGTKKQATNFSLNLIKEEG